MADKNFEILIKLASDLRGAADAIGALKKVEGAATDAGGVNMQLPPELDEIAVRATAAAESLEGIASAVDKDDKASENFTATVTDLFNLLENGSVRSGVKLDDLRKVFDDVAVSGGDVKEKLLELRKAEYEASDESGFDKLRDSMKKTVGETAKLGGGMDQIARSLAGAFGPQGSGMAVQFVQILQKARASGEGLSGALKGVTAAFGPVGLAIMAVTACYALYAKWQELSTAGMKKQMEVLAELSAKRLAAEEAYQAQLEQTGSSHTETANKIFDNEKRAAELEEQAFRVRKKGTDEAIKLSTAFFDEARALRRTNEVLDKNAQRYDNLKKKKVAEMLLGVNTALEEHYAKFERVSDASARLAKETEALEEADKQLLSAQDKLNAMQAAGTYSMAQYEEAVKRVNDILAERSRLEGAKKSTEAVILADKERAVRLQVLELEKAGNFEAARRAQLGFEIWKEAKTLSDERHIQMEGEDGAIARVQKRVGLERALAKEKEANQLKLKQLEAAGDIEGMVALERKIAGQDELNRLMREGGMTMAEATQHVKDTEDAETQRNTSRLEKELEIQKLSAEGNAASAKALQRELSLSDRVADLMRTQKILKQDAVRIAEQEFAIEDKRLAVEKELYEFETKEKALRAAGKTTAADELKIKVDALKIEKQAVELAEQLKTNYEEALKLVKDRKEAENPTEKSKGSENGVKYGKSMKQMEKEQKKIQKDLQSDNFARRDAAQKRAEKYEDKYGQGVDEDVHNFKGRDKKTGKLIDPKKGKEARERNKPSEAAYEEAAKRGKGKDAPAAEKGAPAAAKPSAPAAPSAPSLKEQIKNADAKAKEAASTSGGNKEDPQIQELVKGMQALVVGQKEMSESLKNIEKSARATAATTLNNSSK